MFLIIAGHALVAMANHGLRLLSVFFGDMAEMKWPGPFNLDFMCALMLAGRWMNWRHQFSGAGVVLGLVAEFGGALFLSAYLLVERFWTTVDVRRLLLGAARVS